MMKRKCVFLGLSLVLLIVLGVAILSASTVGAVPRSDVLSAPELLAPRQPTPTPAPWPPGYSPPDLSDIDAQALRPDLVVKSIEVVPSSPYVFDVATIRVTIANEGTAEMDPLNNFYTDLYMGGPGVPGSGERGLICQSGNCSYPDAGFTVRDTILPWGCQGFWVGGIGAQHVLTATVVFSDVKSYYLYAQIDTPEEDYPVGYVYEDPDGGEYNNIYPTDSSIWAQTKAPGRFTQSNHTNWFDNYASSLEVFPASKVLTDINGVQITSDAALKLGYWEEPPICWGTVTDPPSVHCPNYTIDYDVLDPDTRLPTVDIRDQSRPVLATDGITDSQKVVVVWEDQRNSVENPDIYLRWSDSEIDVDGEYHYRQDWQSEFKVNDNVAISEQRNPSVAVSADGDVVVVWQDNRDYSPGDPDAWNIYLQQYYFDSGGLVAVGGNQRVVTTVCPDAAETFPDIAVDTTGMFYAVWQSQCTEQSAIWASKGQAPSPGSPITWDPGRWVVDPSGHERRDPKVEVAYTTVISDLVVDVSDPAVPVYWYSLTELPILAVVWHEDRGAPTGDDIYVTFNSDQMATGFSVDARVNQDNATQWYSRVQDQPVTAVSQTKTNLTVNARTNEGQVIQVELENIPIPAIHVAWQDYRDSTGGDPNPNFVGNDPNIYYAYCPFELDEDTYVLWFPTNANGMAIPEFEMKVNLNDNWSTGWQDHPKQLDPDITVWTHPDFLNSEREIPYEVYVVWADDRNYNRRNQDIYMWHYGDTSDGTQNRQLNDDAKIHTFDPVFFEDYSPDRPPAALQIQPSVSANVGGRLRMAWADNRLSELGANINDVYFTRTNRDLQDYGPIGGIGSRSVGAFLSQALDSCPGKPVGDPDCDTTWFKLDYGGVTPLETWIAVQTRVADTITDVLSAEWYPQDLVWEPQGAYWIPVRGYLGPGAYIVGPGGEWPQARYAQYRVNMWGIGETPTLYYVTLFYGSTSGQGTYGNVYLPVVVKNSSS